MCPDPQLVEEWAGRYEQAMVRFVYTRVGDWATAQDVVQSVFLLVLSGRRRYDPDRITRSIDPIRTWLFWLCRQVLWQQVGRRRAREREAQADEEHHDPPAPGECDPFLEAIRGEDRERVEQAITQLEEKLREVVVLFYIEDMGCEAIAEILETTVGTVHGLLRKAREALADSLLRGRGVDVLVRAVDGLRPELIPAARSYYLEGRSRREIAARLEITVRAVDKVLAAARKDLLASTES